MKSTLREVINRLEQLSDGGKNDNCHVVVSQPDILSAGPIEDICIDCLIDKQYITIIY